jgi:N-acetylglucosaminyldiphosphoundecaprenol N-acetyl-beta-D-mannosaminyltransferase
MSLNPAHAKCSNGPCIESPPLPVLTPRKTHNFLGIPIEALTYGDLFAAVDKWRRNKQARSHHVAVINAYCVTSALTNPRLARIYNGADMIGPDGMPFVYWIRAFFKQPCDQFDASSLVIQLAQHSKETGYTFYLFGGHPDVVVKMKENLESIFPHIKIIGSYSPPFRPLTDEEDSRICAEINRLQPDIICVGLGTPKQDYWIDEHITKIKGAVFIPCGAIFDFFGGRIKRAPRFIQKSGFEWLYRLFSKDFCRLFKRYTVMNAVFLWNFALQMLRIRVRQPQRWQRTEKGAGLHF